MYMLSSSTSGAIFWPQVAGIITAIGTIILGYLQYNQHTKNKMTDAKLAKMKAEAEYEDELKSETIAKIYGVLWEVLYELQADRVYVIQPHPLANASFLSVGYEVKRKGLAKNVIGENLLMADVANFASDLSKREFIFYQKIAQIRDNRVKSLFSANGTETTIIRRLHDENDWVGSLLVGFVNEKSNLNLSVLRERLADIANEIQFDLPEYKNKRKAKG